MAEHSCEDIEGPKAPKIDRSNFEKGAVIPPDFEAFLGAMSKLHMRVTDKKKGNFDEFLKHLDGVIAQLRSLISSGHEKRAVCINVINSYIAAYSEYLMRARQCMLHSAGSRKSLETSDVALPFDQDMAKEAAKKGLKYLDGGVEKFASSTRKKLTREYSKFHYGMDTWQLKAPQAVIIHGTDTHNYRDTKAVFDGEYLKGRSDIRKNSVDAVNVSAHFVVDRDGTIYQMAPLDFICRHAIGYNYTALGIEIVSTPEEQASNEQIRASAWLIKQLRQKFKTVAHVFPHKDYDKGPHTKLIKAKGDPAYVPSKKPKADSYGKDFEKIMTTAKP